MGLRGNLSSVRGLRDTLRSLPLSVAHDVARRGAPAMSAEVSRAFSGGKTVYGDARPASVDGKPLTLRRTGTTESTLKFAANGSVIRAHLTTKYAKYLIGKYGVLPNGPIPTGWAKRLEAIVNDTRAL